MQFMRRCGKNTVPVVLGAAAVISRARPVRALQRKMFATKIIHLVVNVAEYGLAVRLMALLIWQADTPLGKQQGNECVLKPCIRFMTLKSVTATICAWVVAGVMMFVQSIFLFQLQLIS